MSIFLRCSIVGKKEEAVVYPAHHPPVTFKKTDIEKLGAGSHT